MGARDGYTTPEWLCELFPAVDFDPCSNPRSLVRALVAYWLERGENGLKLPWRGTTFINPPYSDPWPWCLRLLRETELGNVTGSGVLVNVDSSTNWWRALRRVHRHRFEFDKRIPFDPPPGVKPSGNDRVQVLWATDWFRDGCAKELDTHGTWWTRDAA